MHTSGLILIVDDQPRGRMTLASLLEPEGYQLAFAADGPQALAEAARLRPDLVLLDVMMPGMDGFEVCRRLRADPNTAEMPLIMVTALDDHDSLLQGIEAGADDFVTKPFNRAELRARIRTVTRLNRYRSLWESRVRYERLIEYSPNGVMIIDPQGQILLINPALRQLIDALPGQLVGQHIATIVAPERWIEMTSQLAALFELHEDNVRFESALLSGTGMRRPVEIDVGWCEWDTGAAGQVLVRDITDRKRAELLEEERRQVAYELHDGVAQVVTSVYQQLQLFIRHYRPRAPQAMAALDQLQALARRAVTETRRVIEGLRPTALDDFGLAGAIEMLADSLREEGWTLNLEIQLGDERLATPIETALFRIAQEALTNTRKYAGTTHAAITLIRSSDSVQLEFRDWGCGFDPETLQQATSLGGRLGLRAMRERALFLGGELRVEAKPGAGVRIIASIPLSVPEHIGERDDESATAKPTNTQCPAGDRR
ncbi:MAG: response regulator [Oscillochloris sp.]|nr:response regulator [Oscillochloris sp.]